MDLTAFLSAATSARKANYENSGSLTDAMNFTPKAVGAPSRSFRMVLNPTINSGNASPGDVVKFDIPVGRPNQFIDTSETCFQFGVLNNTANDAFYLDGSASVLLYPEARCVVSGADA